MIGTRSAKVTLSQSANYKIRVRGLLNAEWSTRYEGLTMKTDLESGETTLVGLIQDQAALHGILRTLYDFGLPLLCVCKLEHD